MIFPSTYYLYNDLLGFTILATGPKHHVEVQACSGVVHRARTTGQCSAERLNNALTPQRRTKEITKTKEIVWG